MEDAQPFALDNFALRFFVGAEDEVAVVATAISDGVIAETRSLCNH